MDHYHHYQECIEACRACASYCNRCATACLQEKEAARLAKCIDLISR